MIVRASLLVHVHLHSPTMPLPMASPMAVRASPLVHLHLLSSRSPDWRLPVASHLTRLRMALFPPPRALAPPCTTPLIMVLPTTLAPAPRFLLVTHTPPLSSIILSPSLMPFLHFHMFPSPSHSPCHSHPQLLPPTFYPWQSPRPKTVTLPVPPSIMRSLTQVSSHLPTHSLKHRFLPASFVSGIFGRSSLVIKQLGCVAPNAHTQDTIPPHPRQLFHSPQRSLPQSSPDPPSLSVLSQSTSSTSSSIALHPHLLP
jgi:hypothetical protein